MDGFGFVPSLSDGSWKKESGSPILTRRQSSGPGSYLPQTFSFVSRMNEVTYPGLCHDCGRLSRLYSELWHSTCSYFVKSINFRDKVIWNLLIGEMELSSIGDNRFCYVLLLIAAEYISNKLCYKAVLAHLVWEHRTQTGKSQSPKMESDRTLCTALWEYYCICGKKSSIKPFVAPEKAAFIQPNCQNKCWHCMFMQKKNK